MAGVIETNLGRVKFGDHQNNKKGEKYIMRGILAGMLFVAIFFCTGCATIMSHGPQTMTIISEPDGADLEISDRRAGSTIVKSKTPHTATLERGDGFFLKKYYDIKLTKAGYMQEKKTITPGLSGWYFANLIFGGGIGAILVDPATGCMWTYYDNQVHIKMYPDSTDGHAAKLTDEKAKADAAAKAEQAILAQTGNQLQYALTEISQKKSKESHVDDLIEGTQKTDPQTQQNIPAASSQPVPEKTQQDALADTFMPSLDYIETLIKGKTTKQDVERDLGKPLQEEESTNGEYLFCSYLCKRTSPEDPAGVTYKLILKYDARGVLSDYRTKALQ